MRATIKAKLAATFAVLVILLAVVIGVGVTKMSTLNTAITDLIDGPARRLSIAQEIDTRQSQALADQQSLILNTDPEAMRGFYKSVVDGENEIDKLVADGKSRASEKGKPYWEEVGKSWTDLKPVFDRVRDLGNANQTDAAIKMSNEVQAPMMERLTTSIKKLGDFQRQRMTEANDETDALYATSRTTMIAAGVIAFVIAVLGAIWISMTVSRGLKRVSVALDAVAIGDLDQEVTVTTNDEIKDLVDTVNRMTGALRKSATLADQIAQGDLTVDHTPLSDKDKLGHALVSMVERLRNVVGDASSAADNVAAGSQQLSASSEQV
ncbi:MCP four helix bundle domain-containing protein, partial [Sphingomonas panni]